MVSFKWAKGIYFQDALFNDFNNDNTTMWFIFLCIYVYTCIYLKDMIFR